MFREEENIGTRLKLLKEYFSEYKKHNKSFENALTKIENAKIRSEIRNSVQLMSIIEKQSVYVCPHTSITVKYGIDGRGEYFEYFCMCDYCGSQIDTIFTSISSVYELITTCEKLGITISRFLNQDGSPVTYETLIDSESAESFRQEKVYVLEALEKFFRTYKVAV